MNIIEGDTATKLAELEIPSVTIAVMNTYGNFLFENGCDCLMPVFSEKDGIFFGIAARHGATTFEISCLKRPNTDMFLLKATRGMGNEHWSYGMVVGKQLLHIQQLIARAKEVFG
jgi:hypothetical protein